MYDSDLILSAGPNCRTAWNVRNYFGIEQAYPFDWWITPARSALKMLDPSFRFSLKAEDLTISSPDHHNTVYNSRLNILHHHDFERTYNGKPGVIETITEQNIATLTSKYIFLFERLRSKIKRSQRPVLVVNGIYSGFQELHDGIPTQPSLNQFISTQDFALAIREMLGEKVRIADIASGAESLSEQPWGWFVRIPDNGDRILPPEHFAEPVHVFQEAFKKIGLRFVSG